MKANQKLILGSTSVYRQKLLTKLGIAFECVKPPFDEEKHKDKSLEPLALAEKLAFLKAESVFEKLTASDPKTMWTVIGSDQLVAFQGQILGKPGTPEKACEQLMKMQNQTHQLITAVCLFHGNSIQFQARTFFEQTEIKMKKLSETQIKKYVDLDNPIDCAGAYKFEAHGLALIAHLKNSDPSAIEGLPLIQLSNILQEFGYEIFSEK